MSRWRHIAFIDPSLLNPGGNLSTIGDPFDLGNGVRLTHLESYMREPPIAGRLDAHGRELLRDTSFVFITEFEADDTTSHQEVSEAFDRTFSASAAIWISTPCPVGIHNAVSLECVGEADAWEMRAHQVGLQRFAVHPDDANTRLSAEDLQLARHLNIVFSAVPENSPTWTAKWFLWLSLQERFWDVKYLCLWSGLEALFGSESENSRRRMVRFLRGDEESFVRVQQAYSARNTVAHGSVLTARLQRHRDKLALLRSTETWLRQALRRIAGDPDLLEIFNSDQRRREYVEHL